MILVPFDGSELSEAALVRAAQFTDAFETDVVAVSIIPQNATYARERDWLVDGQEFDKERIVSTLHERVTELCPTAQFRYEVIGPSGAPGTIAGEVRDVAEDVDASMVFVGSENAGRLVTGVSSVGGNVAARGEYDVLVVRNPDPIRDATDEELEIVDPAKSDFYF